MSDKLTKLWIGAGIRMRNFREDFCKEEKGAADIVAIILVIVVVIAVAAIFRKQLMALVNRIFGEADNFVTNTPLTGE